MSTVMKAKSVQYSRVVMSHLMMPQDANPTGIVHGGVVMRNIDEAASVVAVRHSGSNAVTASIDRLDFQEAVARRKLRLAQKTRQKECRQNMNSC